MEQREAPLDVNKTFTNKERGEVCYLFKRTLRPQCTSEARSPYHTKLLALSQAPLSDLHSALTLLTHGLYTRPIGLNWQSEVSDSPRSSAS